MFVKDHVCIIPLMGDAISLTGRHFLWKCLCQVSKLSGHVFVWWGIDFALLYDFSIRFWYCTNSVLFFCFSIRFWYCSNSVIFFVFQLDFGTVLTGSRTIAPHNFFSVSFRWLYVVLRSFVQLVVYFPCFRF